MASRLRRLMLLQPLRLFGHVSLFLFSLSHPPLLSPMPFCPILILMFPACRGLHLPLLLSHKVSFPFFLLSHHNHKNAFDMFVYRRWVFNDFLTFQCLGFSGSFRRYYSASSSTEQSILSNSEDGGDLLLEKEIAVLRREFESAKQRFLKIPLTLQEMPKMNPKGSFEISLALANICIGCVLSRNSSVFVFHWIIGIYANKNLRLDRLQVYGFDYDYTLAHYSSDLQTLIYDLAKEHMVNEVSTDRLLLYFHFFLVFSYFSR